MKKTYMAPRTEVTRIEEMTLMAASADFEVGKPGDQTFFEPREGNIDVLEPGQTDASDAKRGYDLWED